MALRTVRFSSEQKLRIREYLNAPLELADDSEMSFGDYLRDCLPQALKEQEAQYKERMLAAVAIMVSSAEQSSINNSTDLEEIRNLRWEGGSMERFFGNTDAAALERLGELSDQYFYLPDDRALAETMETEPVPTHRPNVSTNYCGSLHIQNTQKIQHSS